MSGELALKAQIIFQLRIIRQMDNSGKATSYQDLLKSFQQAETSTPSPRAQKLVYRPQQPKPSLHKANKQNMVNKAHTQSAHEKSVVHRSEWVEEDVLKEYNDKRKDRQLELTYNKFITYVTNILASLTNSVPPELLSHHITYLQYLAAMKEMALIKDSYEPSPTDAVSGLWNELSAHGHTCGVFILFLASILHMRRSDDQAAHKYAYLAKKYAELRYTRMELFGKTKTTVEEEEFPFTPAISQRSRTLAGSRSRSKPRKDKCLAQRSFNHYLQEEEEELRPPSPDHLDSLAGNRRSEILYKLAKERSLEKRRDKKSAEVEYEKSIRELTFHPAIHPNVAKARKKKEIQGEQDCINRIIRGRVEREVRRVINQKGLPYNEKMFEKMKREKYEALEKQQRKQQCSHRHVSFPTTTNEDCEEEEIPQLSEREEKTGSNQPIVLTIEVDENRCEKLVIDQPARYKEAAAKFIKDLNLGAEMYDKLIDGVQKALKFQLTQVDEDSCESQNESVE